jgi:hypothetical protein
VYCLTADANTSVFDTVLVVSLGNLGGVTAGFVGAAGACGLPSSFGVRTFDAAGVLSDNIGFTAVVP